MPYSAFDHHHLHPVVFSHNQAHAVMAQFDVAIVPFVADALVKSMSPIKLDDYQRSERRTAVLDPENKKGFDRALIEALNNKMKRA